MKSKIKGFTINYKQGEGIGNRLVVTRGEREPGFQWMIQKEARGVFYDIGANIGWITLLASKKCSELHCFEPDKRSRKYLFMNCHQNRIADRVVINVSAVSDEDGDCRMLYHKKPNLSTTCTGDGSEVPCVRLDTYCINHSPPDAIKMDIEGAEVSAIYGAWETIKKHSPKLFIELHPDKYDKQNNFASVLEKLVDLGYNFKYVENAKDKLDYFKEYTCAKKFSFYKKRRVFTDVSNDAAIKMCIKIDKGGKKLIRSIMMEKP